MSTNIFSTRVFLTHVCAYELEDFSNHRIYLEHRHEILFIEKLAKTNTTKFKNVIRENYQKFYEYVQRPSEFIGGIFQPETENYSPENKILFFRKFNTCFENYSFAKNKYSKRRKSSVLFFRKYFKRRNIWHLEHLSVNLTKKKE